MEIIDNIENVNLPACVAAIGFFDGVHCGHRYLIRQVKEAAKKRGISSGIITFPVHPRKIMQSDYQPQLLSTAEEKTELLAETGIDICIRLEFTHELSLFSARKFMTEILKERLNVQALVIGYDHRFGHNRQEGFEEYCRYGKEIGIEIIPAKAYKCQDIAVSSSVIRTLLQEGKIDMATKCLGYEYCLEGTVINGYKMGRKLGFPTANIRVEDPDKLIPADGVYAVRVTVDGKEYMGMLDIGHRPTLNNGNHKSIEVNILDFSSDIYNQTIRIAFVKRLRSDIKFPNIESLIVQLQRDEIEVRRLLSDR